MFDHSKWFEVYMWPTSVSCFRESRKRGAFNDSEREVGRVEVSMISDREGCWEFKGSESGSSFLPADRCEGRMSTYTGTTVLSRNSPMLQAFMGSVQ